MSKKLKVLLAFDTPYAKPPDYDFAEELAESDWMTEHDVYRALRKNGHKVKLLGIHDNINMPLAAIQDYKPEVVFNATEVFRQNAYFEKNIAWLVEMLGFPYTGASPTSILICNNKALSKKILSFHKIKVPNFYTFYRGRKIRLVKRLRLPLIVKPLREEASRGIAQASVVDDEKSLQERVNFIHQKMQMDAIAEEYIEGREFYVSVIGNKRVKVLPLREMKFGSIPDEEHRLATYKAKWDENYREKWGIQNFFAGRLPEGIDEKIKNICRRAYHALDMQSYARFDLRVTAKGDIYILEVNANPCLAKYDEIGQSAEKAGISYDSFIQRVVSLAFQRIN